MIWHIVRKEVLGNLLSLRFMLSLILIILLFAVSGFVFVSTHKQQLHDYWQETNKNLSALSKNTEQLYKLALHEQEIWRKPHLLSLCVEGFEKSLPDYFKFDVFTIELPKIKGQNNFLLAYFSNLDGVFIISLVLSFMALVFTSHSICGE